MFYKLLDIVFNPENILKHFPPSGYLDFSLLWYLNPNQMISECFLGYVRLGTNPVFHQKTQDVMPESGRRTLQLKTSKCWASLLLLPLTVFVQNSGTHTIPKDSDWTVWGRVWHGYFQKLLRVSNLLPGLRSHFPYHLGTCQFSIFQLFQYQHYWILIFPYNNSCLNTVPKLYTYLGREINHIWSIIQHVFGDYI